MKLQVQKVDKDPELEVLEAEARLYHLSNDELPKGFWTTSEWNDLVMEKIRLRKKITTLKEEMARSLDEHC